ncbi:MAG: PilW family protein [Nitrospira sp.]|nr:PilW family protein [Nitrospira sp.]
MRSHTVGTEHGFTLIELLVAMVIALVVVAVCFTVLVTTSNALRANDQTAETQQNVRIAMDLIASDVKVAGMGMTSQVGGCINTVSGIPTAAAIVPGDQTPTGNDSGADQISVVVPVGNTGWTLASATGNNGFNQITLQSGSGTGMMNAGLNIAAASTAMISINGDVTAVVSSVSGNVLSLATTIPAPLAFPVGAPVFLLQCLRYQIGTPVQCSSTSPCLMRGTVAPDGVATLAPIVDGIEDIQFAYACDGCTGGGIPDGAIDDQNGSGTFDKNDFLTNSTWSTVPATPDKIRLVQVSVVGRQAKTDQGLGERTAAGAWSGAPIQVSDHNAQNDAGFSQATHQQFRRRVLTKTLEVRNVGL